jgi:hypothetical protein
MPPAQLTEHGWKNHITRIARTTPPQDGPPLLVGTTRARAGRCHASSVVVVVVVVVVGIFIAGYKPHIHE